MATAASPSLKSQGGDRDRKSTPTLDRAKNTSRRISVWMQQTWRERGIPAADFGKHSNNSNSSNAGPMRRSASLAGASDTASLGMLSNGISSPFGSPARKRYSTPPAAHKASSSAAAASPQALDEDAAALAPTVANVDEALGAWTSLYKFEHHFSELKAAEAEDDIVDTVDWILDGHQEWHAQYQRSQELLSQMYPGHSNMLSDLNSMSRQDFGGSEEPLRSEALVGDKAGANSTIEDTTADDVDESLLLLKFGSAMGQQEYQFASFETADFSSSNVESALDSKADTNEGNENEKEKENANDQDYRFDADFPNTESPKVETEEIQTETNSKTQKEVHTETNKESADDGTSSEQGNHDAQEVEDESKADLPLHSEDVQNDSETPNESAATEIYEENAETITRTMSIQQQASPIPITTAAEDGTPAAASAAAADTSAAASTTDEHFEEFWQTAMDMPTPETGTFPSFGSQSTYITSPLVDDMFLSPSAFVTKTGEALESIDSQEDDESNPDGDNENGNTTNHFGGVTATDELSPEEDKNDGENDFGEFREDSTPAGKTDSFDGKIKNDNIHERNVDDDENDLGPTIRNETDSAFQLQHEAPVDQSYEEDQEDTLNPVNASFETTATPLPLGITGGKDVSSNSPTFHTGVTPLKKNGRCQSPITPLQTSPSSAREEFTRTPTSHRLFPESEGGRPPVTGETSLSARALQAAEAAAAIEQFTPVTSNFRYWEPGEEDDDDSMEGPHRKPGGRTMLVVPSKTRRAKTTPVKQFQLRDMNKVMNGIPDEDSDVVEGEANIPGDGDTKSQEESVTHGGEESLLDGSTDQSNSIPSVVQLFTKTVDAQRRPKIVVPNTVRATTSQGLMSGPSNANPSTNGGLSMPSFYFGRKRLPSSEIVSLSASEVASASASIMSMPMMKGSSKSKMGSDKVDEPSINSSIASPEVKFLRRNKNTQSRRLLRNRRGGRLSTLSIHSRTSRTTEEGDDGTFDDPFHQQQRGYGDSRVDFYHWYYGHDEEGADSDADSDELTDEESLSLGSLSTLPTEYWKHPELDHTLRELTKLEWDWLPYWQMDRLLDDFDDEKYTNLGSGVGLNADNIPLLQDQITQKLSKLDSFYGKICKKVYRKIQPHAEALLSANQAALDLHQNLQLSQMYLSRSQKSIELAKYGRIRSESSNEGDRGGYDETGEGVGVHGALRLLELWDNQHSYHELARVESVISEICNLESAISQRIRCFDTYKENSRQECESILDMVTALEAKLDADPAKRLVCFDDARERSHCWISEVLVTRLHECLSDLAVEWCHASDSSVSTLYVADGAAYSRLIEILLRIENNQGDSSEPENEGPPNPARAICTSIHTSLLLEIQKAFGRALLDPTDSEAEKSEYEQELSALASNEAYLDATRLPIWTHNLVTIRFEFEMKQGGKHPLPAIFHKLCLLLTNILCGMHRLIEWHDDIPSACDGTVHEKDGAVDLSETTRAAIREELRARRASIWNACIQSMEECLQEYLNHSGKKILFSKREGKHDDSSWREDLEGLHDVSVLSHQFLTLRPFFLEGVPKEVINDGSRIEEKLFSCCKAHLRAFHIEAMNTLGNMFYREDWKVYSFNELKGTTTSISNAEREDDSVRSIFELISEQLQYRVMGQQTLCCRSRCNEFTRSGSENLSKSSLLAGGKNPFEIDRDQLKDSAASSTLAPAGTSWDEFCSNKRVEPIIELLRAYIGDNDDGGMESNVVLKSVFEGVLPWTARLLITMDKLPVLREEACKVMQGIVDLYVTTAFRLCAGKGSNERILLGIDGVSDATTKHQDGSGHHRSTSPPIFDFGFGSKPPQAHSNKPAPVISSTAEAELCALVLEESEGLEGLREFLVASQKRLEGVAKLDLVDGWIRDPAISEDTVEEDFAEATARVLEKRQAASCNHIFVALSLFLVTQGLPASSSSCAMICSYSNQALEVIPLLMSLSNRISCMRSIRGRELLREIISVGSGWEESKLHEQANEYVEDFCDFLALLWQSLYSPGSGKRLPLGILKTLWENLLGGGYMVLLDGFSKVPYCSTEGRALMSMDVSSYRSGTSPRAIAERLADGDNSSCRCPLPMDIRPYRTMAYVDTYIKIFYFPSSDALEWIKTNYEQYHRHHLISLVINDRDAKKLANQVMKCYRGNESAETIRI